MGVQGDFELSSGTPDGVFENSDSVSHLGRQISGSKLLSAAGILRTQEAFLQCSLRNADQIEWLLSITSAQSPA